MLTMAMVAPKKQRTLPPRRNRHNITQNSLIYLLLRVDTQVEELFIELQLRSRTRSARENQGPKARSIEVVKCKENPH
jgi:hypothetical protein